VLDVEASKLDDLGGGNHWRLSPEYRSALDENGNIGENPWSLMGSSSIVDLSVATCSELDTIEPRYGDQGSSREQLPSASSGGLASTDQKFYPMLPEPAFNPALFLAYDPVFTSQPPYHISPTTTSMVPSQPQTWYLGNLPTESFEMFQDYFEHQTASIPEINLPNFF
jgi:hypothetical protein